MTVAAPQTTVINHYGFDHEITPAVGMRFGFDEGYGSWELTTGTDYCDSGFAGCQFYAALLHVKFPTECAVNIRVTGRTIQRPGGIYGSRAVKVEIEWVGDCEASTFTRGWLYFE
jgi:hypothetical protein